MDEIDKEFSEYSLPFSDNDLNLFGDHSFDFDFWDVSTGNNLEFGELSKHQSEGLGLVLSWDLEGHASSHDESIVNHSEILSDDDCVVLSSQPTPSDTTLTSDSVPQSTCDPEERTHGTVSTGKRKWESSVVIFSSNPDAEVKYRRRRGFDEDRRKEVAMNRVIGACIQCKLRKGSCNFGIPCNQCIKRAGSATLGQELCTRQSLLAVRFNNIDFFHITLYEELVQKQSRSPISETRRESYIFWPNCCHRNLSNPLIKVFIEDFREKSEQTMQRMMVRRYIDCVVFHVPDSPTSITKDSLPPLDLLADCYLDSDHSCNTGPFVGLHKAFNDFGKLYCEKSERLPLQSLVGKTLKMKRLLSTYRRAALIKSTPDDPESPFVSSSMRDQLRYHIGKGILADMQLLYGLAKHVYNTLTSIYAALYQTTSPLTLDWRTNETSRLLGQGAELINSFCNIKTEMYWSHGSKDQLLNEDTLFKKLVMENETKLLAAHRKAAKRMGVL